MAFSDSIAILALLLSLVVAAFQLIEWRNASKPLRISIYQVDEITTFASFSAYLTNISNHSIYIEAIWVGNCYRPWLTPWSVKPFEGLPAMGIEGNHISDHSAEGLLKPGELMEISFREKSNSDPVLFPKLKTGFHRRNCIWVEHSSNDAHFFKFRV